MTKKFIIQRMSRCGTWVDEADVASLNEAIGFAKSWARNYPRCAWGVRVWNSDANHVAYDA